MVHRSPVTLRCEEAEGDAEEDGEETGRDRQLDSRGEALPELLDDRAPRLRRLAELTLPDVLEIAPVLNGEGLVEPVLALDLRDCLRRRPFAEQRLCRAARKVPDPEEDQDREPEEDRDEEEQPADGEPKHRGVPPASLSLSECSFCRSYSSKKTVEKNWLSTGLGT